MNEDLYGEKLSWFKENESPEAVLLVTGNQEYIKIIIAWTKLNVERAEQLTDLTSESVNEVWQWLWINVKYSRSDLVEKAGSPFSELVLERKLKPLMGNRILYPDGTVNSFVQRYLRQQVLNLFDAKANRRTRKG